jgi:hypothetical protein
MTNSSLKSILIDIVCILDYIVFDIILPPNCRMSLF